MTQQDFDQHVSNFLPNKNLHIIENRDNIVIFAITKSFYMNICIMIINTLMVEYYEIPDTLSDIQKKCKNIYFHKNDILFGVTSIFDITEVKSAGIGKLLHELIMLEESIKLDSKRVIDKVKKILLEV